MDSKITIEVDLDAGMPYIRVLTAKSSDDVRDKLINRFREKLGHSSSWCRVKFDDTGISGRQMFTIEPVPPSDLQNQFDLMKEELSRKDRITHP